jgi:hypothetical protein
MNLRTRRTRKRSVAPPPVLAGFRIVEFAVIKRPITFSGQSDLIVGRPNEEPKEVGAVPRLAIGQSLRGNREFALLHCTRTWDLLGVQAAYETVGQVKRRAERTYPRVSDAWEPTEVGIRQAKEFERAVWHKMKCSFCGRIPPEQNAADLATVVSSRNANIRGKC